MLHITDALTDPADHLALDEAMLLAADEGEIGDCIRFWEFATATVVAGRSTRVADEIDLELCEAHCIPVLRRCSGGASVVGGPGCLMYSIVLSTAGQESLRKIDVAHQFVMSRLLRGLQRQLPDAQWQGICDLTWNDRKCSGNSLRIARRHLLYHGTVLYDANLQLLGDALAHAPRQPDYRDSRDHSEFVTNVPIDPSRFVADVKEIFGANKLADCEPLRERIRQLRLQRYDDPRWHFRH